FATYGTTTSFKFGQTRIKLACVSPKDAKLGDSFAGLAIRAIKQIGRHKELPTTLLNVRRTASKAEVTVLRLAAPFMPSWLSDLLLDDRTATQRIHSLVSAGRLSPLETHALQEHRKLIPKFT